MNIPKFTVLLLLLLFILFPFKKAISQWGGTNPVTTNSDVGIGLATPSSKLHIWQDQTSIGGGGFSPLFHVQYLVTSGMSSINRNPFFINSSGLIGVGNASPVSQFHIYNYIGAATNSFEINKLYSSITHAVWMDSRFHSAYQSYNAAIQSGDGGIIYSDQQGTGGDNSSSGFFIGPKAASVKKGLRLDASGNTTVYGTFTINNGTYNNFQVSTSGALIARQIDVNLTTIPDYVFAPTYKLMNLHDLEKFIIIHKHLPNVKSALEYEKAGSINIGELSVTLLEKVEELTLHIIELNKRIEELEKATEK